MPICPSAEPAPGPLGVVAAGASAGGLEALEEFFAAVPKDSGLAYVVVQHLERRHPSMLAELLVPSRSGRRSKRRCLET